MKKKQHLWMLLLVLVSNYLFAQQSIRTHTEFSTQTLVKDIFASGVCDNIDVISTIGNEDGVGYFENGLESLGIESGIILSTGITQNAHGPNDATDKSTNLSGPNNDADLERLASGDVHDPVGIEFDFVPLDSVVQFRYVFASEEYCEFVGSDYNDVFGFFVSGPGINGPFANEAINVALVPGTSEYVAINSVNFNDNSEYYIHNELADDQQQCNLPVMSSPHLNAIEYDGFTKVLTARLVLQPCEIYHIRLVVGDVSDAFFDSAVFLEAGSFSTVPEISVDAIGQTAGANQLFEGCEDAVFRFSRTSDTPYDYPFTVEFHTAGASTASAGTDYEAIPQTVVIPANELYYDLLIRSLLDDLEEEEELLRLVLDIPCACYSDSADLYIVPPPPLEVDLPDAYLCPGDEGLLTADLSGGVPPFQYLWSTGSTEAETPIPAENNYHVLQIEDLCGQSLTDTVQVALRSPPVAALSGNEQLCAGDTAWFPLQLEGTPPFILELERNGEPLSIQLPEMTDVLPLTQAGNYELLEVHDAACAGLASGQAALQLWEILAEATTTPVSCFGDQDGTISVNLSQGTPPYRLNWLHSGEETDVVGALAAGWYDLEVEDANNCIGRFSWEITQPAPLRLSDPLCDDLLNGEILVSAMGGTAPYRYEVSESGNWLPERDWLIGLSAGETYTVGILDANGCTDRFPWVMPQVYPDGMAWLPSEVKMPLGTEGPLEWECYVPNPVLAALSWDPSEQFSCSNCLGPEISAIHSTDFSLTIEDIFGCKQQIFSKLVVDNSVAIYIPNAFSPNGDDNNDLWSIYGNERQIERIVQLLIFDRWGNMMFQADDWPINSDRHGWDGTFRGQLMDTGVYAYSIQVRLVNGGSEDLGWGCFAAAVAPAYPLVV